MGSFQEMVWVAAGSFVGAFVLSVLMGRWILPVLRAKKCGQHIFEEGPAWHKNKEGTPTMGGVSFVPAFIVMAAAISLCWGIKYSGTALIPLALTVLFAVGNAAIGFIDDYYKLVVKKANQGLTTLQKLLLQVVLCAAYIAMMAITDHLTTVLNLPFTDRTIDLGWFAYILYVLVLMGFVNATNLTDGLDGLASSITAVVAIFTTFVAVSGGFADSAMLSAALAGCVLGFLIYNHHPAKMFMGDTGSLFLGGVLMGCAVMMNQLLLIVLAGFVFVIEMLSSLLQIVYFHLTHGKRLFKMAPLHHHFEKCGWKETPIVLLFTGVTLLLCILAWFGL